MTHPAVRDLFQTLSRHPAFQEILAKALRHEASELALAGLTPTAKALDLMGPLREALDQLRITLHSHKDFSPARGKLTVTVACTDYVQAAVLMPFAVTLRQRAPGIPILVGLWPADEEVLHNERVRSSVGADFYVTSLREAVDTCIAEAKNDSNSVTPFTGRNVTLPMKTAGP